MVMIASKGVKAQLAGESDGRYARALGRMISVICAGVEASGSTAGAARASTAQRRETKRGRVAR
jgi:hypothetical protein